MSEDSIIPNKFGPDTRQDFHVLKDGDLFAVFPASGEMNGSGVPIGEARSKDGLFYRDTRYLSRLSMSINGAGLIEMGHDAREDDTAFRCDLANTQLIDSQGREVQDFELHIRRDRVLSGGLHDRIEITNYSPDAVDLDIALDCWADYRDIFEVRGAVTERRGELQPVQAGDGRITFGYETADGRRLSTAVQIDPAPDFASGRGHIRLNIPAQGRRVIACHVEVREVREDTADAGDDAPESAAPRYDPVPAAASRFESAAQMASERMSRRIDRMPRLRTSRPAFDAWLTRSAADLALLTDDLPTGPYPHAGIPWFAVPFGRDALITAMQVLWLDPDLAGGVLDFLAATQAAEVDPFRDAEPGKILHEHRNGELARIGAVPFHHYYGGIDQTLLFVVLAEAHWARTGDRARLHRLEPAVRAAMDWAATYGDRDGDGFIEYERSAETGLRNQGWKDSEDAVFHRDGTFAKTPIALVEVQAYLVAALRAASTIYAALGDGDRAKDFAARSSALIDKIDAAFWDEGLGTYCIALDDRDRPVRVSASNAGHLPLFGAALPKRFDRLFATLAAPGLRSGWGIRTVATNAARFNPMGYHNGSIWPHDNSLIAAGAARCGQTALAAQITTELFDASSHFPEHRLPELWCGFARDGTGRPVSFPSACAPQAWAAGAAFLCVQACLGIDMDAARGTIRIGRPVLPAGLDWVEIEGLSLGGMTADIAFRAEDANRVSVEVLHCDHGLTIDHAEGRRVDPIIKTRAGPYP